MSKKDECQILSQELIDLEKKIDAFYHEATLSPPKFLSQKILKHAKQQLEKDYFENTSNELNVLPTEELEQKINDLSQGLQLSPPSQLDKIIKAKAWKSVQKTKNDDKKSSWYSDQFLAMAAAESNKSIAGERKSQSGEWTIRIFTDRDNPEEGYVTLEVCSERAETFEGKLVTLTIGTQTLFSIPIHQGEAEAPVSLVGLDINKPWEIRID